MNFRRRARRSLTLRCSTSAAIARSSRRRRASLSNRFAHAEEGDRSATEFEFLAGAELLCRREHCQDPGARQILVPGSGAVEEGRSYRPPTLFSTALFFFYWFPLFDSFKVQILNRISLNLKEP